MPTCGSLFSGIGLLDYGLHLAGWEHRWFCEADEFRRGVLRRRFPGAVVFDDVRTLRGEAAAAATGDGRERGTERDEHAAESELPTGGDAERRGLPYRARPVTLVAGGFPCKGASTAGKRGGFEHAETVLWHEMRRVIGEVRPRYVLIENVSNILGMAASPSEPPGSLWGTVLADLAALGFDVVWDCIPAASVGAPHLRDRVLAVGVSVDAFVSAQSGGGMCAVASESAGAHAERDGGQRRQSNGRADVAGGDRVATPDADRAQRQGHGRAIGVRAQVAGAHGVHAGAAADTERRVHRRAESREVPSAARTREGEAPQRQRVWSDVADGAVGCRVEWGDYAPAIRRWEAIHGPAPEPLIRRLDDGDAKLRKLRARMDRSRLSALGDGIHVYVGWLAGEYVMSLEHERRMAVAA